MREWVHKEDVLRPRTLINIEKLLERYQTESPDNDYRGGISASEALACAMVNRINLERVGSISFILG